MSNPVEFKHCKTSRYYRVLHLMKLKLQKDGYFFFWKMMTSHEYQGLSKLAVVKKIGPQMRICVGSAFRWGCWLLHQSLDHCFDYHLIRPWYMVNVSIYQRCVFWYLMQHYVPSLGLNPGPRFKSYVVKISNVHHFLDGEPIKCLRFEIFVVLFS